MSKQIGHFFVTDTQTAPIIYKSFKSSPSRVLLSIICSHLTLAPNCHPNHNFEEEKQEHQNYLFFSSRAPSLSPSSFYPFSLTIVIIDIAIIIGIGIIAIYFFADPPLSFFDNISVFLAFWRYIVFVFHIVNW